MTLTFTSLSLTNFGPYRLVDNLVLSPSVDSPVILIHGENTLGKTQLFAALRWCLYGTFVPQQTIEDANHLLPARLNRIARREGATDFSVKLVFEASGRTYSLTRTAHVGDGGSRSSADLRIGARAMPNAAIDEEIGRLLHPQISEFFLFDGELMQRFYERLAARRERDLIRLSIDQVLGVPALQLARDDVLTLAASASERQAKATRGQQESERLRKRLAQLAESVAAQTRDRQELARLQTVTEAALADVRASVKAVEGLEGDVREQEFVEAQLATGKARIASLEQEKRRLLGQGWLAPVAQLLARRLREVEAANSAALAAGASLRSTQARVRLLEERIRGGTCPTCFQSLPPADPETLEQLEAERTAHTLLQAGAAEPDLLLERRVRSLVDTETAKRYAEKNAEAVELAKLQYQRRQNLESIKDRLRGHDAAEIRSLGQRQDALDRALERGEKELAKAEKDLTALIGEQEKVRRQLDKLPGAQPRIAVESAFYEYLRALLDDTVVSFQERTRAAVEEMASNTFKRLVRDADRYQGLRIGKDYTVDLLDQYGMPMETSEGGRLLVALSLIGALKHSAVRGGPVVLDSPLGRLDRKHRANVLQDWVPSLGSQAILLVQSGELTPEEATMFLEGRIAEQYMIRRPGKDPEEAVVERIR